MTRVLWTFREFEPGWESAQVNNGLTFLTAAEQNQWQTLRFAKKRSERLFGRYTAKALLAIDGMTSDSVEVANDPDGVPRVFQGGREVAGCLSISHRQRAAFCAWSRADGVSLGADVEWIEPRSAAFVGDYLTEGERASLPPGEGDLYINLIWSAKESVLKALKTGLKIDPLRIDISIERPIKLDRGWQRFRVNGMSAVYGVWQRRGVYVLTLAVKLGPMREPVELIEIKTKEG